MNAPATSGDERNAAGLGTGLERLNIGCGQTPTPGWRNIDNSASLLLARSRLLTAALRALGMLSASQLEYIRFAQTNAIEWADATKRIPVRDGGASVLYTSHMLEHLDRTGAIAFLREAHRVLAPGGLLRVVVPNLEVYLARYAVDGDADTFMASILTCAPRPRGVRQRLGSALVGPRHHLWMYDGASLGSLLRCSGFVDVTILRAGETRISEPGALDLHERASVSVYVEAVRQ